MYFTKDNWHRFQVDYPAVSSGPFSIEVFDIAEDDKTRVAWILRDGPDRDPGFGTFRRLVEIMPPGPDDAIDSVRKMVWMSDTRAEILEHMPFIEKIPAIKPKRILINGLGLGLAVKAALKSPRVEHVHVVEINPDVINLVSPLIKDDRVTILEGDAYNIEWPTGMKWDMIWHDIWPMINDENLLGMRRLRNKYRNRNQWQGCWQMKGCLKMAKVMKQAKDGTLSPETAQEVIAGNLRL